MFKKKGVMDSTSSLSKAHVQTVDRSQHSFVTPNECLLSTIEEVANAGFTDLRIISEKISATELNIHFWCNVIKKVIVIGVMFGLGVLAAKCDQTALVYLIAGFIAVYAIYSVALEKSSFVDRIHSRNELFARVRSDINYLEGKGTIDHEKAKQLRNY